MDNGHGFNKAFFVVLDNADARNIMTKLKIIPTYFGLLIRAQKESLKGKHRTMDTIP